MYDCAQSAITFNNINLPTYDIHSKQARQQILFNFHKLTQSFAIISMKHIEKSKQQNQRINQLKNRILNCKSKIQQFQSSNQALIFVSPADYPKKYKFDPENNVSIFKQYLRKTQLNKLDMNAHYQVKHDVQKLGQQSKLKIHQLNNFIVFLLGQLQGKKKSIFERSLHPSRRKQYTLGQLPSRVQYIDSLLLFNSHINPYRKYELTNNIVQKRSQANRNKQVQESQKNQILIDIMLVNYQKPKYQQQSIHFVRIQQQLKMPDFDLNLGLAGIVDYDNGIYQGKDFNLNQNIQKKNVPQDPYANKNKNQSNSKNNNTIANNSQTSLSSNYNILPTSSLDSELPPPPSLGSILPPPPSLGNILPPPPSLGNMLPPPNSINLTLPPAPTLHLNLPPAPNLGMLPKINNSKPAPASGGGISALLQQLQNPNPMARLRRTVTIQKGGINASSDPASGPNDNQVPGQKKPARQMTFMEALQAKIQRRFQLLNMQKQQSN